MAKIAGIPSSFTIDDSGGSPVTFSNEVGTISIDTTMNLQDVSGLDVEGTERITLRSDYTLSFSGFVDDGGSVISVFGDLRGARTWSASINGGLSIGGECVLSKFTPAVSQDGSVGWSAEGASADGNVAVWS